MNQSTPSHTVKILGLAGSLRERSYTRSAVELALAGAREAAAETAFLDLRSLELPFCKHPRADGCAEVSALRAAIQTSQGFILGTPEYHGALSGVLKNALDLTEPEDWRGKVIGLIGVSGGSAGPGATLLGLRGIGRALHAWVLPNQVAIPAARHAFDEAGQARSAELAKSLRELGAEVVRCASRFAELPG